MSKYLHLVILRWVFQGLVSINLETRVSHRMPGYDLVVLIPIGTFIELNLYICDLVINIVISICLISLGSFVSNLRFLVHMLQGRQAYDGSFRKLPEN